MYNPLPCIRQNGTSAIDKASLAAGYGMVQIGLPAHRPLAGIALYNYLALLLIFHSSCCLAPLPLQTNSDLGSQSFHS